MERGALVSPPLSGLDQGSAKDEGMLEEHRPGARSPAQLPQEAAG